MVNLRIPPSQLSKFQAIPPARRYLPTPSPSLQGSSDWSDASPKVAGFHHRLQGALNQAESSLEEALGIWQEALSSCSETERTQLEGMFEEDDNFKSLRYGAIIQKADLTLCRKIWERWSMRMWDVSRHMPKTLSRAFLVAIKDLAGCCSGVEAVRIIEEARQLRVEGRKTSRGSMRGVSSDEELQLWDLREAMEIWKANHPNSDDSDAGEDEAEELDALGDTVTMRRPRATSEPSTPQPRKRKSLFSVKPFATKRRQHTRGAATTPQLSPVEEMSFEAWDANQFQNDYSGDEAEPSIKISPVREQEASPLPVENGRGVALPLNDLHDDSISVVGEASAFENEMEKVPSDFGSDGALDQSISFSNITAENERQTSNLDLEQSTAMEECSIVPLGRPPPTVQSPGVCAPSVETVQKTFPDDTSHRSLWSTLGAMQSKVPHAPTIKNGTIQPRELSTLLEQISEAASTFEPGQWLTDTSIDAALALLPNTSTKKVSGSLLDDAPARPLDTLRINEEMTKIIAPVSLKFPHRHWCLGVLDMQRHTIQLYDPLPDDHHTSTAREKLLHLADHLSKDREKSNRPTWSFSSMICPRQSNGHDCGVFVIVMACHLLLNCGLPKFINGQSWRRLYITIFRNLEKFCYQDRNDGGNLLHDDMLTDDAMDNLSKDLLGNRSTQYEKQCQSLQCAYNLVQSAVGYLTIERDVHSRMQVDEHLEALRIMQLDKNFLAFPAQFRQQIQDAYVRTEASMIAHKVKEEGTVTMLTTLLPAWTDAAEWLILEKSVALSKLRRANEAIQQRLNAEIEANKTMLNDVYSKRQTFEADVEARRRELENQEAKAAAKVQELVEKNMRLGDPRIFDTPTSGLCDRTI